MNMNVELEGVKVEVDFPEKIENRSKNLIKYFQSSIRRKTVAGGAGARSEGWKAARSILESRKPF